MKLARRVAIIGVGLTKFGALGQVTSRELFTEAAYKAMQDAGADGKDIDAIFVGNLSSDLFESQLHTAPLLPDYLGLKNIPAARVEGACASGGISLKSAVMAVASGMHDTVIAGGVEKMTNLPTPEVTQVLSLCSDGFCEVPMGITFPGVFAMMAKRHMYEYGTLEEDLAHVAVKNHDNGLLNPYAQFHKKITVEKVMNSIKVADPLKLYDCSPITDGAAAVIVTAVENLDKFSGHPVEIVASVQASESMALQHRRDYTGFKTTKVAAEKAYKMANLTPKDIQIAEVHDCFTIAEVMAIEDLGFVPKGEGGKAVQEGITTRDGQLPVNTSGGLKAKGHPIGATGIAQAIEIVKQIRGEAGQRQVPDVEIGLTQNLGGSGATIVVNILKKM